MKQVTKYFICWLLVTLVIWSPLNKDCLGGQVETAFRIAENIAVTVHFIALYFVLEGL